MASSGSLPKTGGITTRLILTQLMKEVARTPGPRGQQHWPPRSQKESAQRRSNGYCEGAKHREAGSAAIAGPDPPDAASLTRSCAATATCGCADQRLADHVNRFRRSQGPRSWPRAGIIGMTIPTAWPVARRMRARPAHNRSDLPQHFQRPTATAGSAPWRSNCCGTAIVCYVSRELMKRDRHLVSRRSASWITVLIWITSLWTRPGNFS